MNVLTTTSNLLLQRREFRVSLTQNVPPTLVDVQTAIAEHAKVSNDCVVINRVSNAYGSHEFVADAFVYDSAEAKTRFELKPRIKKGAGAS